MLKSIELKTLDYSNASAYFDSTARIMAQEEKIRKKVLDLGLQAIGQEHLVIIFFSETDLYQFLKFIALEIV